MIWGAFGSTLKSNLVFVPTKVNMNSALYVKYIIEPHLVPFWHKYCEKYGYVGVVEDGTPGHKGFANQYKMLNEMKQIRWPAHSHDLNLIEALWMDMEAELGKAWGQVGDIPTLETVLNTVWHNGIPPERLENLIHSMPQ